MVMLFNFLINKNVKKYEKKLEQIGEDIAHELRTPLITLKAGISGIKDCMDKLIEIYHVATNTPNLKVPELLPQELISLKEVLDHCERETYYISNYTNILSANLIDAPYQEELDVISIKECVKKAFYTYPYRTKFQKNILSIDFTFDDFKFIGNEMAMVYLFSNLIKNAMREIEENGNGFVDITTKIGNDKSIVIFKQTGKKISEKKSREIFDRFCTMNINNGLGLYFCKRVMKAMQGDIIYQSNDNGCNEFILKFLNIDNKL